MTCFVTLIETSARFVYTTSRLVALYNPLRPYRRWPGQTEDSLKAVGALFTQQSKLWIQTYILSLSLV